MIVVDGALRAPRRALEHALTRDYGRALGPDGLEYDGVSMDVPGWLAGDLYGAINRAVGPVEPTMMFLRLSLAGSKPPQWAHSDSRLGDATAVVYLTKSPPPGSGTVVLRHVGGLDRHPETPAEYETWNRDHSDPSRWVPLEVAAMRFNRMVLLPGETMHAALPKAGFGEGAWNGRLALVTFFRKLGE